MKTNLETKASFAKRRPKLFLSIVAMVSAGLLISVWTVYSYFFINYAAQTAKPLESALVKAGATKKCSTGDNGRGPDNNAPWYGAYYELPVGRDEAISTINKIATDNGYSLSHASSTNRGSILVADAYINNWFYDTIGKSSPYKDLQAGKVKLFFVVNNDGPIQLSKLACKTSEPVKVNNGASTSSINIQVKLPAFK